MLSANLTATPNPGIYGQPVVLEWTTTDAVNVTLNGEQVEPNGSKTITAATEEEWRLEAYDLEGMMVDSVVNLTIEYPPVLAMIWASAKLVCPGTQVTISWQTQNATRVTINGEEVSPSGEMQVIPSGSENYHLEAEAVNAEGWQTADVSVEVYEEGGEIQVPPYPGPDWSEHHVTFTRSMYEGQEPLSYDGEGEYLSPGEITTDLPEAIQYFPFTCPLGQVGLARAAFAQPQWNPAWAHPNTPPWVRYQSIQWCANVIAACGGSIEHNGVTYTSQNVAQYQLDRWTTFTWPAGYVWNRSATNQPPGFDPPRIEESGLVDDSGTVTAVLTLGWGAGAGMFRLARWATGRIAARAPVATPPHNVIFVQQGQALPTTIPPNTVVIIRSNALTPQAQYNLHLDAIRAGFRRFPPAAD